MGKVYLTIDKDKTLERIQALELELAGLKEELNKPDKFEFKYLYKECCFIGSSWVSPKMEGNDNKSLKHFRYRQTLENAESDLQLQKEMMCIGALAEQIDPDYKSRVDWYNHACRKYHISYDYQEKNYYVSSSLYSRMLGVVFMPQEVATQVCKILNNKGVEL